ncbi:MAG TPA: FAD:protein FMN transferase, partial [Longimicrobiaceae bacterium]|nr:FAD:protein FMN transferase [Longimicrobiaceae bacterium]
GRRPGEAALRRARSASGWDRFEVDAMAGTVVRRDSLAWIDTGAFGKGAALRGVRRVLEREGVRAALFDFGGQLLAVGTPPGEGAWPVAVAHPARRREPFAELRLRDRSVSTSSASERWVEESGERLGHILDPRTGRPVPAWGSVTVVAEDAFAADAVSTALFVMGPEEGMRWAKERTDVGVLFLVERGGAVEARWNAGLEPFRTGREGMIDIQGRPDARSVP